jgi:hypothetical protein
MKVQFNCDSGANIHSCRSEIIDLNKWNITDEEWDDMNEDQRFELVEQWAWDRLNIWWEEV